MKNLSKKQKVLLIVCAAVLLTSGTIGTIFGVKKHNETKAINAKAE